MQEAGNKEINDVIPDNDHDSCFAPWKTKILEAIDHIKTIRHKRADINAIFDCLNKNTASNINKNAIENFISQLTKQKIIINKMTPAGCDSFCLTKKDNHEIVSEEVPRSPVISNEIDTPCSDRLISPLQNDVVNLKKPVKEGNYIDFQISTSNRFNHVTVAEPSREEVG